MSLFVIFFLALNRTVFSQQTPEDIYWKHKLFHVQPKPATNVGDISIFLHAAVGIFQIKRKRPGQIRDTWVLHYFEI